jgi:hypothetical protein
MSTAHLTIAIRDHLHTIGAAAATAAEALDSNPALDLALSRLAKALDPAPATAIAPAAGR